MKEIKGTKEIYVNGVLFFIRKKIVLLIPENSWIFRQLSLLGMRLNGLKNRKKRTAMKIDIPAVEHCNLRCKGCTAFSPLAKESFLDYEGYCRDMRRLADLTGHQLTQVTYTGGEPLLHPRLGDMIQFARSLFPTAEISFLTNGLLLPSQSGDFWRICSACDVKVSISRYPIQLNEQKITEIKNKWGIAFDWVGGKDIPVKKMWKYPIDLAGKVPLRNSFQICSQINSCIRMKDGRIYACNTTACIEHFSQYFGKQLELVSGKDYIELEKVKSIDEIFSFFITPPAFCRYCNRAGVTFGYDWAVSQKDIGEWT